MVLVKKYKLIKLANIGKKMNIFTKISSHFRQRRINRRKYWIKRLITKQLLLDNKQQEELEQLINTMEISKSHLHQNISQQFMQDIFADEQFNTELAKTTINTDIKDEFEKILDLIAEFYNQLQDNQKQKFRQLIRSTKHCCGVTAC